jgi:hypothetical protein
MRKTTRLELAAQDIAIWYDELEGRPPSEEELQDLYGLIEKLIRAIETVKPHPPL